MSSKSKKLPLPRNDWSPANRLPDAEGVVTEAFRRGMPEEVVWDHVAREYSFAVPSTEVLDRLLQLGPILDVGAGNGYWAYRLERAGGDVVAIEPSPRCANPCRLTYRGDHTLVTHPRLTGRALLMVWPTRGGTWPAEAVAAFPGTHVAYIGDPEMETCATPALAEELERAGFVEVDRVPVLSWPSFPDELIVFERRETTGAVHHSGLRSPERRSGT